MPCIAFLGHDAIDVSCGETGRRIRRIYACPSVLPFGRGYARPGASLSGLWMTAPARCWRSGKRRRWEIRVGFPSFFFFIGELPCVPLPCDGLCVFRAGGFLLAYWAFLSFIRFVGCVDGFLDFLCFAFVIMILG